MVIHFIKNWNLAPLREKLPNQSIENFIPPWWSIEWIFTQNLKCVSLLLNLIFSLSRRSIEWAFTKSFFLPKTEILGAEGAYSAPRCFKLASLNCPLSIHPGYVAVLPLQSFLQAHSKRIIICKWRKSLSSSPFLRYQTCYIRFQLLRYLLGHP